MSILLCSSEYETLKGNTSSKYYLFTSGRVTGDFYFLNYKFRYL